jgi:hypothetical protein
MDTIVIVKPILTEDYPLWISQGGKILHSELQPTKPIEYDLKSLVSLHERPEGFEQVGEIYRSLKAKGLLGRALGYSDLKAISAKGLEVFTTLFPGKILSAFRSATCNSDGELLVPSIFGGVTHICEVCLFGDFPLIPEHPILGFPESESAEPVLETDCGIAP